MRSATKNSRQVLVPLSDLWQAGHGPGAGVSGIPARFDEQARFIEEAYDVVVHYDYADRPCVTLPDAYQIRDRRKQAQQELLDAHTAELVEAGRVEEWQRARDEFWRHNLPEQGRRHPIGIDPRRWEPVNACRQAVADQCEAAERVAGIDKDTQRRLTWPSFTAFLAYDDAHTAYTPPSF